MYFSQGKVHEVLRMSLRVLLADESTTIKKAIQVALSEYGVEVKSVPSGLDVLAVTHTFRPELILIDTLLTKKNGYEVCTELKTDPKTAEIPVILMWSNFIQLDNAQATKAQADETLEKPFDTESLRALVEKLVPKTLSHPLRGRLSHPPLPDFVESETFVRQKKQVTGATSIPSEPSATTTFPSEEEEDQFSHKSLSGKSVSNKMGTSSLRVNKPESYNAMDENDEWSTGSPNQFIVETDDQGEFEEVTIVTSKEKLSQPSQLQNRIQEQVSSYLKDSPMTQNISQKMHLGSKPMSQFEEQLLKEEIKLMAERICWQIIPDLAEKIIREELQKLMQGIEKNT